MLGEKRYFPPAPAARLWVDEERLVVDVDDIWQRWSQVERIDVGREQVRFVRLLRRPFYVALTIVLRDQREPRLFFRVSQPDDVRAALRERGWVVEDSRGKLRPWTAARR
jgi:hypothetical protein